VESDKQKTDSVWCDMNVGKREKQARKSVLRRLATGVKGSLPSFKMASGKWSSPNSLTDFSPHFYPKSVDMGTAYVYIHKLDRV